MSGEHKGEAAWKPKIRQPLLSDSMNLQQPLIKYIAYTDLHLPTVAAGQHRTECLGRKQYFSILDIMDVIFVNRYVVVSLYSDAF